MSITSYTALEWIKGKRPARRLCRHGWKASGRYHMRCYKCASVKSR